MGVIISSYSLVTTIVLYNLALVLIYLLRRKNSFMARCGTEVMLFITLLAVIRLLSPVDFPRAYIVRSETFAPAVKNFLTFSPLASLPAVNPGNLAGCIWLAGTCRFVAKYASELHRAVRSRRAYVSVSNETVERAIEDLGVKYPVVVSGQVSSPHTAGFFRPVIYLSKTEHSQREWEYILMHEGQHIKTHDIWIKLFYAILETVMWWNPVSHLFMLELDAMLEMRCDAAVASTLSEKERTDYLTTILSEARESPADASAMVSAHLTRYEECFQERFYKVYCTEKKTNRRMKYAVCAVALALFCLSYFVVIQPDYGLPFESWMDAGVEGKADEQFIFFDGENYYLYVNNIMNKNLSSIEVTGERYNSLPIYEGEK